MSWQAILVGLVTGIIATLIADNPSVRFNLEKLFRKLIGKPLISATLTGFTNYCSDGFFLLYCIELENKMWLTSQIPRVYLLSEGTFDYDSYTYKPFIYFRARGISDSINYTTEQLLEEYGKRIIPYTPDNPALSLTLSKWMPYRIVFLCELVKHEDSQKHPPLNHWKIVGDLHLPISNPMPKINPGARWNIRVISEDFGLIDVFYLSIPKDLKELQPMGSSAEVYGMKERPPLLLDLGIEMQLTWRLRFNIDNCKIVVKSDTQKKFEIIKPKKLTHKLNIIRVLKREIIRKHEIDINSGIKIQ